MMRAVDRGDMYVHQDANWNVIGTTDLGAAIVERNVYTPYGQLTVHQETAPGDYDGDQYVDATDRAAGEVGGSCRTLDLDFDNDVDDADLTLFDNLTQGIARHPGRTATATSQPFAHQGLLFEPELASYQNRARQYMPNERRFAQRDSLAFLERSFGAKINYTDGLNLIEYVGSNPGNTSDPEGLVYSPTAPSIGTDCAQQEGQTSLCNVETCCQCGYGTKGLFQTTTGCQCRSGPLPSQTTWQEKCGDGTFSAGPSGCNHEVRSGADSKPCDCKLCCTDNHH